MLSKLPLYQKEGQIMKMHYMTKILLCLVIFLFPISSGWAYSIVSTPDLLISSGGEGTHTVDPRAIADGYMLQNTTTSPAYSSGNYSATGTGYSQTSSADPGSFQVATAISAEGGINYSSADGVFKWFVLNGGTPGSTVSLTADIAFQAQISVSDPSGNSTAAFTNYLGFLSSTTSTQYEYLIVQNGVVHPLGSTSWGLAGTVATVKYSSEGTYYINEVIRSKSLDVTIGTPFRLALVLNTSTGTNSDPDGIASIDFDPGFYTGYFSDGFAVYNNGNYTSLSSSG
jgi:hypothetical protein